MVKGPLMFMGLTHDPRKNNLNLEMVSGQFKYCSFQ